MQIGLIPFQVLHHMIDEFLTDSKFFFFYCIVTPFCTCWDVCTNVFLDKSALVY